MADHERSPSLLLVEGLARPAAYPYPVDRVECVQTHISWVFLAGPYAYKVKRPVRFDFLDYSTLERRRQLCHEEVRLNRRLAPDVYLGVVPITATADGWRMEGEGEALEWAVKMVRLPQERMLDVLLAAGAVSEADLRRLAGRLAAFHAQAATGPGVDEFGARGVIAGNWEENFAEVAPFVGDLLTAAQLERCRRFVARQLDEGAAAFAARVAQGRIRDCHGDLRAESVWLGEDGRLEIFDCLEFNPRLRCGDVAGEVAFLASDLDWRGRPDLAWGFVDEYVARAEDAGLADLLPFYKCYRAFVRGKVAGLTIQADGLAADVVERQRASARQRFVLAELYTRRLRPTLLLTCGQVGSGKTTTAQALGSLLGLPLRSSDRVRKELAGLGPLEHRPAPLDAGLYAPAATRATYDALYAWAAARLGRGQSVVLDATFSQAAERKRARQVAEAAGAEFLVVHTVLPDAVVRERLARREADPANVSDAGVALYERARARFEPPVEVPAANRYVLDTSGARGPAWLELAQHIAAACGV